MKNGPDIGVLQRRVEELERKVEEAAAREEASRGTGERYAALLKRSLFCVYLHDLEGRFLDANAAALRLLGYSREEIPSVNFITLLDESQLDLAAASLEEILRTGQQSSPSRFRLTRKDGGSVWVETEGSLVYRNGKPCAVQGIARDITDRKRAEEAVEAERKRLFDVLDGLPALVCLQAPDHSIRFANRYFRERFGEPAGRPCYRVLRDRDLPCETCNTFKVFSSNEPQVWEWGTARDGRSYQIHDYPFTDVDGSFLVLELGIDITERRKAEADLVRARELFSKTFLLSPIPTAITSLDDGKIRKVNRAFTLLTECTQEQVAGRAPTDLDLWDDPRAREEMLRALREHGHVRDLEARIRTRSGQVRDCLFSAELVNLDGEAHFVSMAVDHTERKRMEEELRDREQRLSGIFAAMTDHASVIDRNHNILWANGVAAELFGPHLEGRKCYAAYHGRERACEPCIVSRAFEDGAVHEHETEVEAADGSTRTFWCTASVARTDPDGRPLAVVEVSRDISERRRVLRERESLIAELRATLSKVRTLSGLLPICASCKKVRDDRGYWHQVEAYVRDHTDADFSHGICPECTRRLYPQYADKVLDRLRREEE